MIYVAVDEIPMCIRVCVCVCIYASGRGQMHGERKVKHNDVSFNASVVIFYLRTTRDNGRPAYEYRAKTVVSLCHTRARVLMKFTLFWRTLVCTQMRLCTAHTRVLYKRERGQAHVLVTQRLLFILRQFPSVTTLPHRENGCRTIGDRQEGG